MKCILCNQDTCVVNRHYCFLRSIQTNLPWSMLFDDGLFLNSLIGGGFGSNGSGSIFITSVLVCLELNWKCPMLQHHKISQHQQQCESCQDMSKKLKKANIRKKVLTSMFFHVMYSSCAKNFKNATQT